MSVRSGSASGRGKGKGVVCFSTVDGARTTLPDTVRAALGSLTVTLWSRFYEWCDRLRRDSRHTHNAMPSK